MIGPIQCACSRKGGVYPSLPPPRAPLRREVQTEFAEYKVRAARLLLERDRAHGPPPPRGGAQGGGTPFAAAHAHAAAFQGGPAFLHVPWEGFTVSAAARALALQEGGGRPAGGADPAAAATLAAAEAARAVAARRAEEARDQGTVPRRGETGRGGG